MEKFKSAIFLILGAIVVLLFYPGCSDPAKWQDHSGKNDPILGDKDENGEDPLIGAWRVTRWFLNDTDGNLVEDWPYGDGLEHIFTFNSDGTMTLKLIEDGETEVLEGTYEATATTIKPDVEEEDDWWDQEWNYDIDTSVDPNTMILSIETDEGIEGYDLEKMPDDPLIGEWTFSRWFALDEDGNVTEEEELGVEEQESFTFNADGSMQYIWTDGEAEEVIDGTYEATEDQLTISIGDDWWDATWDYEIDTSADPMVLTIIKEFEEDGEQLIEGYDLEKGAGGPGPTEVSIVNDWCIIAWTEFDEEGNITGQENAGTLTGEFEEADYLWFEEDGSFAFKWVFIEDREIAEEESGTGTYELEDETVIITTDEESHWGGEAGEGQSWQYELIEGDTVKLHITDPEMGWLFIPMDMVHEDAQTDRPE